MRNKSGEIELDARSIAENADEWLAEERRRFFSKNHTPSNKLFHNLSATFRERLFLVGNRAGSRSRLMPGRLSKVLEPFAPM